ncbi:DEAD/DEAH box helicase family protein [Paracrocinitomix mangrovi]|uniref:DEAD/DEAH box helicase n=1 Tax=Paracrocinitomix mangrovi TaxID=2862509 RepID=UPI001C8D5EE0|nr:DEAD/DEAH box helicase family protein [Paracrocinitomix mangrovi]UKN02057.1 DEAD/DEAH box helicase family protein [Paracrocinitomix mangrovi]
MIDKSLFKKKELYPFQKKVVDQIISELTEQGENFNLLFQLPTGGGKTVIFSNIAREYIQKNNKKVLILTHRIELCIQTSKQLTALNVGNKVINSMVKELEDQNEFDSFTAMVETLNNRLQDDSEFIKNVGLVIVDEAHNNSFRKIFQYFENVNILGVTATPLSSNKSLPLKDNYDKLIVGESIKSLIEGGYLSDAETYTYDVNLHGLKIGVNGDFTVSSSDKVYSNYFMQEKLLFAYEEVAVGKKTLIFNSGIESSKSVYELFKKNNYKVRHLDSTFSDTDRKDILKWFKETPGAVLTSVGILTTGFDEPTVETIILNRATRSLTLYHQMIGRGSRKLEHKSNFQVIDLGNNVRRFGYWQEYIDWQDAFNYPDRFLESRLSEEDDMLFEADYELSRTLKDRLKHPEKLEEFSMKEIYEQCISEGKKGKDAVDISLDNHFEVVAENSEDMYDGLLLLQDLQDDIERRLKHYTKCITKATDNYLNWLKETYNRQLSQRIRAELDAE